MWFGKKYVASGQCIEGYEVLDVIGEGRYGICYLVVHNGKRYVYKDFKKREWKKSGKKAFLEAEILQMLRKPFFPKLFHVVHTKEKYGLLLEYIEGSTIEEWLFRDEYIFLKEERKKIFLQLLECVRSLHQMEIVHRDIRPSNVIYHQEKIYLIDFGLARKQNETKYVPQVDFSYLGHFLLYLYYSDFPKKQLKKKPWYDELPLSEKEKLFCKRLLGFEPKFTNIADVEQFYCEL